MILSLEIHSPLVKKLYWMLKIRNVYDNPSNKNSALLLNSWIFSMVFSFVGKLEHYWNLVKWFNIQTRDEQKKWDLTASLLG